MKKIEGRFFKNFGKKFLNEIFEQCHSAEKCKLVESKKLQKSRIVTKKNPSEKHQGGILCFRGSERRCFCCGRGSGVSSMLWTCVVQVDDVEQMNKKVGRSL